MCCNMEHFCPLMVDWWDCRQTDFPITIAFRVFLSSKSPPVHFCNLMCSNYPLSVQTQHTSSSLSTLYKIDMIQSHINALVEILILNMGFEI